MSDNILDFLKTVSAADSYKCLLKTILCLPCSEIPIVTEMSGQRGN